MPTFTTHDGTELTTTVLGGSGEPVVVLPGGPLRPSRYLGNFGGLDAHRELVLLDLPHRRVDQIVGDVEALRGHLDRDTIDVIGHSAGANLALLHAAAHPDRVGRLALITPGTRVVGIRPTDAELAARESGVVRAPADDSPGSPDDFATYYGDGVFDVEAARAGLAKVGADVLILVGSLDVGSPIRLGVELGELFAHAEVVVQPGAGHYPWLDDPTWFVQTLQRFFG